MSMQIIELVIDEDSENIGVEAVSVVEQPAIEIDFVALKEHEIKLNVDDDKRILLGPALVPNKQIYRRDEEFGEYYIFFSKDTVSQASQLFLKSYRQSSATFEHEFTIDGMIVVESWIVENPEMDKAKEYGFSVPKGTWMISMNVDNDEVWANVKDGKVKGFSIEGHFADKLQMSKPTTDEQTLNAIIKIIQDAENENSK